MTAPDHTESENIPPTTVAMFTTPNCSGVNRRERIPVTTSVTTMPAYFAIEV